MKIKKQIYGWDFWRFEFTNTSNSLQESNRHGASLTTKTCILKNLFSFYDRMGYLKMDKSTALLQPLAVFIETKQKLSVSIWLNKFIIKISFEATDREREREGRHQSCDQTSWFVCIMFQFLCVQQIWHPHRGQPFNDKVISKKWGLNLLLGNRFGSGCGPRSVLTPCLAAINEGHN